MIFGTEVQFGTLMFLRSVPIKNLYISMTFHNIGTEVQIYYKKYYVRIRILKIVLLIFLYLCVPTKKEVFLWQLKRMTIS
jgi:hypothetical protein